MYGADFYLILLVYVDVNISQTVLIGFGTLLHAYFGILESLLVKVSAYQFLGAVKSVLGNLAAGEHTYLVLKFRCLSLAYSMEHNLLDLGVLLNEHLQPDLVTRYLESPDLDICKQTCSPKAFHGLGDVRSGYRQTLGHSQT